MSSNREYEDFYFDCAIDLAEEFQDKEPESYEDFADKYPRWKEYKTNTDELLEAYLEFLETDVEWREKFDQYCVDEFHSRCRNEDDYDR